MSPGERLIWAAVFAQVFCEHMNVLQKADPARLRSGATPVTPSPDKVAMEATRKGANMAAVAVASVRQQSQQAIPQVATPDFDVRVMLDNMVRK